jgi:hypothetical protein
MALKETPQFEEAQLAERALQIYQKLARDAKGDPETMVRSLHTRLGALDNNFEQARADFARTNPSQNFELEVGALVHLKMNFADIARKAERIRSSAMELLDRISTCSGDSPYEIGYSLSVLPDFEESLDPEVGERIFPGLEAELAVEALLYLKINWRTMLESIPGANHGGEFLHEVSNAFVEGLTAASRAARLDEERLRQRESDIASLQSNLRLALDPTKPADDN